LGRGWRRTSSSGSPRRSPSTSTPPGPTPRTPTAGAGGRDSPPTLCSNPPSFAGHCTPPLRPPPVCGSACRRVDALWPRGAAPSRGTSRSYSPSCMGPFPASLTPLVGRGDVSCLCRSGIPATSQRPPERQSSRPHRGPHLTAHTPIPALSDRYPRTPRSSAWPLACGLPPPPPGGLPGMPDAAAAAGPPHLCITFNGCGWLYIYHWGVPAPPPAIMVGPGP